MIVVEVGYQLFLPFKIKAVTTEWEDVIVPPTLCLPFKIKAVTTKTFGFDYKVLLCLPFKMRAVTTYYIYLCYDIRECNMGMIYPHRKAVQSHVLYCMFNGWSLSRDHQL